MKNIDKATVGGRIKYIRTDKLGLSVEDFSKKFNNPRPSKGTVSKWENGKYLPNNERLKTIADLGDMTVEELLYGQRNSIIRNAIDSAYQDLIQDLSEKEIEEIKNDADRFNNFLDKLFDKYSKYDELTLPSENLYLNARRMAFNEIQKEHIKGSRTTESSKKYLDWILESAHVKVSKYEHESETQKAILEGKMLQEPFTIAINGLIELKSEIFNIENEKNKNSYSGHIIAKISQTNLYLKSLLNDYKNSSESIDESFCKEIDFLIFTLDSLVTKFKTSTEYEQLDQIKPMLFYNEEP